MGRRGASFTSLALVAVFAAGCGISLPTPVDPCPKTVEGALAAAEGNDDAYVATGFVIRFLPGAPLTQRGYEINVQTRNGESYFNTILVRMADRQPGIVDGQAVIVMALRTDRNTIVEPGGMCGPLIPISEDQL